MTGSRSRSGRLALALLAAFLPPLPAACSQVSGTVRALPSGAPIPYARVLLFDAALTSFLETRASWRGDYSIEAPAGSYRLAASARDRAYLELGITLSAAPLRQDLDLPPETEPGSWALVGDTSPEELGASNSGALLGDGSLLFCHDTRDAIRFDPVLPLKTFAPDSSDYQGCVGITLMGDGDLVFVGGQKSTDFRDATTRVKSFRTTTGLWTIEPSLNDERWYPGLARLADERLLTCGGGQSPAAQRTASCELRDPVTRAWRRTTPMPQASEYSPMALLHTGEVLKNWFPPELFDPATETWRPTGPFAQQADRAALFPDHSDHSMVVLRNGEALIAGILPLATSPDPVMVEHYDPCTGSWTPGGDNVVARSRIEAAQLPDGRLFVAAGKLEEVDPSVPVNAWGYTALADLYDPGRRSWRSVAPLRIQREYHATTLLLADARVLTTGGTGQPGQTGSPDMGIDVFSPPYLARGPRPAIDAVSAGTAQNGEWLALDVSFAPAVTSVILLGTQATTHWVDGGIPRRLALAFRQLGPRVEARVPASPLAAMAGPYLLFVMVDDVPSVGRMIRVIPAASAPSADSVGNALRAVKAGPDVVLDWRRGPLNPSRYNVYRVPRKADVDFTPSGIGSQTPIVRPDEEAWWDAGAVPGGNALEFYQVLGRNCDGTSTWP